MRHLEDTSACWQIGEKTADKDSCRKSNRQTFKHVLNRFVAVLYIFSYIFALNILRVFQGQIKTYNQKGPLQLQKRDQSMADEVVSTREIFSSN